MRPTLPSYASITKDADSLPDLILQRSQKFLVFNPLVLLLGLVSQIVFPRRDEPVHHRPFCDRRPVNSRARGDGNVGLRNNWMIYEVVDACRERMEKF